MLLNTTSPGLKTKHHADFKAPCGIRTRGRLARGEGEEGGRTLRADNEGAEHPLHRQVELYFVRSHFIAAQCGKKNKT